MKSKKRRAVPARSLQHIYKISDDSGVIFYRSEDHLVYFSIQSVMARRHNMRVYCSCHMYNHIHNLSAPVDPVQLIDHEHDINSVFVQAYNKETGRSGPLFQRPFGSAPKQSEKDQRSALIYIFNNPVEKKLCHRSIEDRWTFLAYYENDYPFSERPVLSQARWAYRNAVKLIENEYNAGRWLKYPMLHYLFSQLNTREKEQLTDFIVQRYFFFDRQSCYSLFGGYEQMLNAIDITKGKEFDVGEVYDQQSDIAIREMCLLAGRYGLLKAGLPLLNLPESRCASFAEYLRTHTSATNRQISRFLHLQHGK
ncbi:MAG: hypothetical protein K5849_02675 [Bacteroidales bacterium]|nr:hypothetical protein [Bacteroidales bacterium]